VNWGDIALSRPEKAHHLSVDLRRRNFLIRCCQGLSATLAPIGLRGARFSSKFSLDSGQAAPCDSDFHLFPQYREQMPLDRVLLEVRAGLDSFLIERYHDQIAAILADWSSKLVQSPQAVQAIGGLFTPDFEGFSTRSAESRRVRSGALEVHRKKFHSPSGRGSDFLRELQSDLSVFSNFLIAEFQVTSIEAGPRSASAPMPVVLKTRVRYDLVGSGRDFYREQRVGEWELEWVASTKDEYRIRRWLGFDETRSRAVAPLYAEITQNAFGSNSSYAAQLLRGADYWRTVLDGACGIDIYGHNGVSVGDIDNDGFDDVYVCQPAGLPNRLYRNRGDGTFEDITDGTGLGILENTACALIADFNNDGWQDLLVVRTNGPLLFLNQGGGKFRRQPEAFRFARPPQGTFTGAALADYDRDGWLDVYFCLYIYYQGTDQYKYPLPYYDAQNGPPNFLMRNNRDDSFRDVTVDAGLDKNNTRYSFCCGWSDFNRDGWPDLYVVNDFGRKNLYRNNGDGTFTDVASQAGIEDVGAGMGVCWFDCDNDGREDLYVADMWSAAGMRISMQQEFQPDASPEVKALYRKHARGNSLFRNESDRAFRDTSASAGVEMGRWSWSSDAWDFDHDGFADLYIANGMVTGASRDDLNSFFWRQVIANSPAEAKLVQAYEQGWSAVNELIRSDATWSGFERNVFYANNRDGTFSDVSGAIGLDFPEDGRAFALSDFDHDGRLEVLLKNRNGPQVRLLKNVMTELGSSIAFRLRGTKSNYDAIGAVLTLETESGRQTRMLQAGSGFLSQHSKEIFFGLGEAKGTLKASIRWPSGLVQELNDLPSNHRVWVEEGSAPSRVEPFKTQRYSSRPTPQPRMPEPLPLKAESWLLAPLAAPDFRLSDLAGGSQTLSSFRGNTVLLNFWTTESERCRRELGVFDELHNGWATQGLHLLTVNLDHPRELEKFQALTRERRWSFPILLGSEDVAGIYNILYRYLFDRHRDLVLPTSFLIDAKGNVVKVYQGPVNSEHLEQDVRQIPQTDEDRLAKALPFPGVTDASEFRPNSLSFGSVYFQRGYLDQAKVFFERALRDDPESAEALYGLGSVYLKQNKNAAARESFERAVKLRASYPDTVPNAWNNLGLLATREGRMPEAAQYFQEALRENPNHFIALENLGNTYRQQGNWDEARKLLSNAVALKPDDPEANYNLGMVFAQLNQTDQAYDYLQKALKLRPGYPEALNNLGVLYLRTRRRDKAVASFEQSIRVAPEFDQSYLNLAKVYALEGNRNQARAILLELLRQHPNHPQAQKALADLSR
jgi:Tfp pilus assembly protein PilF/peroxiredoxin